MVTRFSSWFRAALLLALLLTARWSVRAQSGGVGTITPDAPAVFDVRAAAMGLLVPQRPAARRAAATPAIALLAYQPDGAAGCCFNPGPPAGLKIRLAQWGAAHIALPPLGQQVARLPDEDRLTGAPTLLQDYPAPTPNQ